MSTHSFQTIRSLKPGQTAVIEQIVCECSESERLQCLGIRCGAVVRMLSAGSACALQVGESRMVLRGEQLDSIQVSILY